jgi:hypothetical protein
VVAIADRLIGFRQQVAIGDDQVGGRCKHAFNTVEIDAFHARVFLRLPMAE